jgi:uroporphyrinogen-III synthase
VVAVAAYATVTRIPTGTEREALAASDVVVFASGSAVDAWIEAGLGHRARDEPGRDLLVVAIGPSTARTAAAHGLGPHDVAARPDADAVVAAVVRAVRARAEPERPTP